MIFALDVLFWLAILGIALYYGHKRGFRWLALFKEFGWRCESRCALGGFGCRCTHRAHHFGFHECRHGGVWSRTMADHPTRLPT